MGLTSALNTAIFGLTHNQRQIDVTAANIANANTAGYTAKRVEADVYFDKHGNVSGLLTSDIRRDVDRAIQAGYWDSLAANAYAKTFSGYTSEIDRTIGTIGDSSSLPSLMSKLNTNLAALVSAPDSYAARQEFLGTADLLARRLNSTYESFQDMRARADSAIGNQVGEVNQLLKRVEEIDAAIQKAKLTGMPGVDLYDQRDRYLEQLSGYLDVSVSFDTNGYTRINTYSGQILFAEGKAAQIEFKTTGTLKPGQDGNSITVVTPGGTPYDLVDASRSGSLMALVNLRDNTMPQAQAQLDELASQLSLAFSNVPVASTPATVGAETGATLDLAGLQSGNAVSLTYVDSGGVTRNVSFVAVRDPALLPLPASTTARPDDIVYGIDISSGNTATYIAQIATALTGSNLAVANDGTGKLRVLGDTASGTVMRSLSANVTVTGSANQGLGLAVFVDARNGQQLYTGALENGGQKTGFARSIALDATLKTDSSRLVNYQTTPTTNSPKDSSRPQYLLDALTKTNRPFDAAVGIGTEGDPFRGTVMNFVTQFVTFQGEQAQTAKEEASARSTLTQNLALRYEEDYKVDVDEELGFLVQLQNAYSANARVMQAAREMFDVLLNSV
ncbi:flagellar hook-associated protein FlgK [Pannonibacter tanglangensis]|uniref:Flagellar hook-associated protein 1 n=1 Tax=Pannonibacter tanglangensis TaxID=2750084 RepID=A0ABW9ZFA2_9HYPH|nr:flagellar hook-associated protein FlgK [Pannonibacter sp. XCT-34]NBN63522.1 flagellar hook-associated protein FlgK [Pannonibacter sp. XCT-34]